MRIFSLPLHLSPFFTHLPPRHYNIDKVPPTSHYSQYLSAKQDIPKSLPPTHPQPLPIYLQKPYPLARQKRSLMKPDTFDFKPFPTSSNQFAKIYPHFHNEKSLMKPDTFNYKPFPFSLQHLHPAHHLIIFLVCFYIEKLRKRSQFEKVQWNKKNEISRIWMGVRRLIYPTFHIFLLYGQIHLYHFNTYIYREREKGKGNRAV